MVTPRYPPEVGGVERHVWEVARRVSTMGCDVTVLCTARTRACIGSETRDGVKVRRVRAWPATGDSLFAPALWSAMAGGDWDVIHVQSYHTFVAPIAMARARQLRVPFVLTFHGGGHSSTVRHRLRSVHRRALGGLIRRSAALVALAHFEITQYGPELRVPPEKFRLIPNGVDIDTTSPNRDTGPDEPTVVASVGRMERYKGHHRVIAAMPDVLAVRPDARLWIIGDGRERTHLEQQARRLGIRDRVEFSHVPSDDPMAMAALLRRAHVVVTLSNFETHPLAALEAAALGRPLVVADSSGLRELADHGFARAVPLQAAPRTVARALLDELDNVGRRAGDMQLPSWDECASRLVCLYGDVARTR